MRRRGTFSGHAFLRMFSRRSQLQKTEPIRLIICQLSCRFPGCTIVYVMTAFLLKRQHQWRHVNATIPTIYRCPVQPAQRFADRAEIRIR